MEENKIRFSKKRELAQIMSDTLEFFKQEYKEILRMIGMYVLPFLVLYAGAQIYLQKNVLVNIDLSDPESLMSSLKPLQLNLFIFLLFGLFVQSLLVGTYYSYLEAYIKHGKGNFQLSDISSKFFSNSLMALGAGVVFTFASVFGLTLCFLPGIYLANTLSLMVFITIFEKKGIGYAATKSWSLVNTQWWNTLTLNVLGLVLFYAIGLVFSIPSMILGISGGFGAALSESPVEYPNWYWMLSGFASIASTIALIVPYTFLAFQYFNLEERENPGEELAN
jgi:hypothetical protein